MKGRSDFMQVTKTKNTILYQARLFASIWERRQIRRMRGVNRTRVLDGRQHTARTNPGYVVRLIPGVCFGHGQIVWSADYIQLSCKGTGAHLFMISHSHSSNLLRILWFSWERLGNETKSWVHYQLKYLHGYNYRRPRWNHVNSSLSWST